VGVPGEDFGEQRRSRIGTLNLAMRRGREAIAIAIAIAIAMNGRYDENAECRMDMEMEMEMKHVFLPRSEIMHQVLLLLLYVVRTCLVPISSALL
jgi:hypothetical protein